MSVSIEELVASTDPAQLRLAASDLRLTEDLADALLKRRDLAGTVLEALSRNPAIIKRRPVLVGIAGHPRTPRHVSLPMIRRLFTFEVLKLALTPAVAPDIKKVAEDTIVSRIETISSGERLTLAKQGSTAIAAALLCDVEHRIVAAALANPRLTEFEVAKAIRRENAPIHLVQLVCESRWYLRIDVRMALLISEHTPLPKAILIAEKLRPSQVEEVLAQSRLPENIQRYLLAMPR